MLYQNRAKALDADLSDSRQLADLLFRFYAHTEPDIHEFEQAVEEFGKRVPDLARGLAAEDRRSAHRATAASRTRSPPSSRSASVSLNPNISREAVDEMLVQHLLTERLFRTIFDNPEFTRRNAIAAEVERVIDALVSQSFSRTEYLKSLDSVLPGHRERRPDHRRFQREAALPQQRLRALLPRLLGEGGGHARHRLHAAADRGVHVRRGGGSARSASSAFRFPRPA